MKKITKIKLKIESDYDADLDHIGTWSDECGKYGLLHNKDRYMNEMAYFNSTNAESIEEARRDYKRMKQFLSRDVEMLGFYAEATIETWQDSTGAGAGRIRNVIRTPGLWGVDSDASSSDYAEIEGQQLEDLKDVLMELGFVEEEIEAFTPEYVETPLHL